MKRTSLGGLLMATALVAWAAGAAEGEQPRRGGILTWFDYGDPARLDVHSESALVTQQATAGVFSGLLHYDPDDPTKIAPDLAERWDAAADGRVYTFHLRQGVKWHDGKPFTAVDVKATFDRVLNPQFHGPRCGAMLKPIVERAEMVDDSTVRVRLKFPSATFLPAVASAWCRIIAKHILERDGDLIQTRSQIGTGPFRFKRYERDNLIEWERNPEYFRPGLPYLDGVKQFILKGKTPPLAAAKAGKIMLWDTWPPMTQSMADEVSQARGDAIEIYRWPINTIFAIHMNTQRPPFNNREIRWAVNLAIDRQELVGKTLEGAGVPCAILDPKIHGDLALPLDEVNRLPGCRQPKDQDLAEAKRLVQKHYPNGLDVELAVRSVGNYVDRAQLVAAQLRKIGMRGALKTYESAAGYSVFGKGEFTIIASQDTAMVLSDPSDPFTLLYTTMAGRNWGKWSDPKVDELAERGLRATDPAKRKGIYHELQRYLFSQDTPLVMVGWVEGFFFRDKRVQNYRPAPTIYDSNTFMKVWLTE